MRATTLIAAALLGAHPGAGAVSEAPAPAPAHLAALAFPGWSDSAPGRVHTVQMPSGAGAGWSVGAVRVVVEPKLVLRDGDHLTLIAGLVPAGEDGRPAVAQPTPMALAAYRFERAADGWRIGAHQGVFAWRGFAGTATLRAVALPERRQGLGVEYGGCWDGYCGTWLALYETNKDGMRREPAVELALSGTNVDGAADCPRRLQPLRKPRAPDAAVHRGAAEHDCYDIDGSWAIEATGELHIRYQGAISRAETRLSPPVAIDQRQVLRYGSGKYRAVSGFNPVPPL